MLKSTKPLKIVLGVIGGLLLLVVIAKWAPERNGSHAALASSSASATEVITRSAPATPPDKPFEAKVQDSRPVEASPAKLGEKVDFEDSTWSVSEASRAGKILKSNNMFQENAQTEGQFILVHFKVTNKKTTEERLMGQPMLRDSKQREFSPYDHETFYIPKNAKTLGFSALPPSMARDFWAVYEVPADSTGFQFVTRELAADGATRAVELGI